MEDSRPRDTEALRLWAQKLRAHKSAVRTPPKSWGGVDIQMRVTNAMAGTKVPSVKLNAFGLFQSNLVTKNVGTISPGMKVIEKERLVVLSTWPFSSGNL